VPVPETAALLAECVGEEARKQLLVLEVRPIRSWNSGLWWWSFSLVTVWQLGTEVIGMVITAPVFHEATADAAEAGPGAAEDGKGEAEEDEERAGKRRKTEASGGEEAKQDSTGDASKEAAQQQESTVEEKESAEQETTVGASKESTADASKEDGKAPEPLSCEGCVDADHGPGARCGGRW
jgi:hypothetical protein